VPGGERLLEPGLLTVSLRLFLQCLRNHFGQRIHELRDKADLSLRRLAKLAGTLDVSPDKLKQYDIRANRRSQTLNGFGS
jgi:hypothetical protein